MSARNKAEALEVLRDVWQGQSQGATDLADAGGAGDGCKRMTEAGVGFDDFGGASETDRAANWRARLEREGKLNPSGRGLRDLVLRPGTQR